ncbi:MAG TPA: LpqB family beta-propeller domain-containing protein [Candidatus Saccharimonadaceae bacterium]|nr:LpqB family beta-propeller domain-containing protein [Candidatus Saccharimonadaceae bacterium]
MSRCRVGGPRAFATCRALARRAVRGALLLACLALASGSPARATPLREIETRDLRLVYPSPTLDYLAPYAARCFENSMRAHRARFDYTPSERVTVVLVDNSDFGNAAVVGSPRNTLIVQIAPTNFVYETGPANERINFVMNHELAHVVTLDQAAGRDRFFRRAFLGKVREDAEHPETVLYGFLTMPRRAAPRWHREGTAVFMETWMAGGLGRAQGPYDEMVFRAMVRDGARFYDPLGLEAEGTKTDFQIGVNAYLYGTRFTSWLVDTYGPPKFLEWVSRHAGSRAYFANQFENVYGRTVNDAWRQWRDSERAFQLANLDSIRHHPTTPARDLSARALGSVSRACWDEKTGMLYAGVFPSGEIAHLAAIPLAGGAPRRLHEVKGPALHFVCSLAWDAQGRRLFYTADNNEWRDLCVLDPATGHSRVLIRDARLGDLAFDAADRTLWAVRHLNGVSTVVRLVAPYTDWSQVVTFPYGRDVFDLDVSPDGARLACSMAEISGRQSLRLFDVATLARGDTTSRTLWDFGASIPQGFVFAPDGRALFGTSYYTGVSNVFRYDLAADSMDIVTNAETGYFRPVPLGGDSLAVFRYAGGGFVPAIVHVHPLTDVSAIRFFGRQVIDDHPELAGWKVPPPSHVALDSLITRQGPYRGLREVRVVSLFPIVESYREHGAVGLEARAQDPLAMTDATLSASVSTDARFHGDERAHVRAHVRHGAFDLELGHDPASFYDLFGPTHASRKGDHLGLGWQRPLIRDTPHLMDLRVFADGWRGLERLPDAENVATSAGFDQLAGLGVELTERNLRASIGAVENETGWQWRGTGLANGVRFVRSGAATWQSYPSLELAADVGAPLGPPHASLWLRVAGGAASGARDDPFANFFFGGFGNNVVDHQEPKRFRDPASFPGIDIDAAAGTRFARAQIEADVPPLRFDRLGTPAFYASWLRPSLFATVLSANPDRADARRNLGDAGVQCDVRFALWTQQPLTWSFGYARAFERRASSTGEWMTSLKVL